MRHGNLRNIDLNLLVILEALLSTNNVTSAARELGLSQPAASRALSRLRQLFDDPLFVRSGLAMVPTPLAISLIGDVNNILDKTRDLLASRDFEPGSASNNFRIDSPDATIAVLFSKVLKSVRILAPGMSFTFSNQTVGRLDALATGEIDLAIDLYEEVPKGYHRKSLIDDHLVCIARQDHEAIQEVLSMGTYSCCAHVGMQTSSGRKLEKSLQKRDIKLRYAVRVSNFASAAAIVADTDLLLSLPRNVAYLLKPMFPISIYEMPISLPRHPLDLVWHERVHHHPAHVWIREQITKMVASHHINM